MGIISDNSQARAAFKMVALQAAPTSFLRQWYQEQFGTKPILYSNQIRADRPEKAFTPLDATSYATLNPNIVEAVSLKQMTLIPGTNGHAFALYDTFGDINSDLLGDWISPFQDGQGYFPRFFTDAIGTSEIVTTFGDDGWFFNPDNGFLIYAGETPTDNWASQGVTEVYVSCFRYTGRFLDETTNAANIADAIVTHELNAIGNPHYTNDVPTGSFIRLGPLVVVDNNGNVVVSGDNT